MKKIINRIQKTLIPIIFLALSIIMIVFIILHVDKIQSNIFKLLQVELPYSNQQALQQIQKNMESEMLFLSNDSDFLLRIESLNQSYKLFTELYISPQYTQKQQQDFLATFQTLLLATLDYQTYTKILTNAQDFLHNQIQGLFNPFVFRLLPVSADLLNLASHSSLINNPNGLQIDVYKQRLYKESPEGIYYFANAKLKENFDSTMLLQFYETIKNEAKAQNIDIIIYSNSLFSSYAKREGNKESLYMGGMSLIVVALILLLAFSSLRIFYLVFVIGFSFLCGLSAVFFFLQEVHLLSLVISTSLVGLVLDFPIHWLSLNDKKMIGDSNIHVIRKFFLLSVSITSFGYALFLLSPMRFLHEIAVLSIFTLLGASLATYFLLPIFFSKHSFYSQRIFQTSVMHTITCAKYCTSTLFKPLCIIVITCGLIGAIAFIHTSFEDNIRDYSSLPDHLLQESKRFFAIMGNTQNTDILIIDSKNLPCYSDKQITTLANLSSPCECQSPLCDSAMCRIQEYSHKVSCHFLDIQRNVLQILQQKNLISDYDGITKFFLTPLEQQTLQNSLKILYDNPNFYDNYKSLGVNKQLLQDALHKLIAMPLITVEDILQSHLREKFQQFIIPQDISSSINHSQFNRESNFTESNLSNRKDYLSIIFLKNVVKNQEFFTILESFHMRVINIVELLNSEFSAIKKNALILKLSAYLIAWVILSLFFGLLKGSKIVFFVLLANMLTLFIFFIMGIQYNIFVIFGLILAGAVGIDYMLIAFNTHIHLHQRVTGILLASLTSIVSFSLLATSSTYAIFTFGLSTSLTMLFCAIFAICISINKDSSIL
ncbi:hypothetical protein CQA66_00130 [Helicobacter aurati]|uniref:Membrane transport protein MMPL domain-containing protein n=1 Tax=Helicobacter aurati TaxID=137778 RepID=A0A3D8J885_9HELI|nr:hypothetical protein [Helicobacter aurati]RDU73642.1 hypothetical protein CQA66_00130 [Helicobacter aurati]